MTHHAVSRFFSRAVLIADLRQRPSIHCAFPNIGNKPYPWQFDAPSGLLGLDIDKPMLINDGESVIQATIAGQGVRQAPHCPAAAALGRASAAFVMPDIISTGSPRCNLYPQKRHPSARWQAFIEWVSELFQRTCEPPCRINARGAMDVATKEIARITAAV